MELRKLCNAGLWDRPCRNPATYQFEHAPSGTASPIRVKATICTRHKNQIEHGEYKYGNYIQTSPFEPLAPQPCKAGGRLNGLGKAERIERIHTGVQT